jgi:hypothetical protein
MVATPRKKVGRVTGIGMSKSWRKLGSVGFCK